MFGLRRSNSIVYSWRDIPNEIVATRARESNWSIGKVRDAVATQSLDILARLAVTLNCEVEEVKCERCDFPLITLEDLAKGVIVHVERIEPNGYVAHPASVGCHKKTALASDVDDQVLSEVQVKLDSAKAKAEGVASKAKAKKAKA